MASQQTSRPCTTCWYIMTIPRILFFSVFPLPSTPSTPIPAMSHTSFTNTNFQEIREARHNLNEWFYNTTPYKLCAHLPLPKRVRKFFAKRVEDIIEYGAEFTVIWVLVVCLVTVSGYHGAESRRHQASIVGDFKTVVSTPYFEEAMANALPRTYEWYVFWMAQWILAKRRARRVVDAAGWLIRFNRSKVVRALFGPSPTDAIRFYQSLRLKDPFSLKIPEGYEHLSYYPIVSILISSFVMFLPLPQTFTFFFTSTHLS